MNTKEKILVAINRVLPCNNYDSEDIIFSQKYGFTATAMVYILLEFTKDFGFDITDDFVDALENCTFSQLEALLEKCSGTRALGLSAS